LVQKGHHFINIDEVKIESKEHMWKPAPIVGRQFNQRVIQEPEINLPLSNNYMSGNYRTISDVDSFSQSQQLSK
jgi:hypothetical protein